jgi:hypothetical protein
MGVKEGGKILGLLGFRIRENLEDVSKFGEVSALVVNAKEKRRGVRRFMMDYAEKLTYFINSSATNRPATDSLNWLITAGED